MRKEKIIEKKGHEHTNYLLSKKIKIQTAYIHFKMFRLIMHRLQKKRAYLLMEDR